MGLSDQHHNTNHSPQQDPMRADSMFCCIERCFLQKGHVSLPSKPKAGFMDVVLIRSYGSNIVPI